MGSTEQQIHHILFVDNTILFSFHEEAYVQNLFNMIGLFEEASGLNTNRLKSEILGINCEENWSAHLAGKFGCKQSFWPSTYLGLPLYEKPSSLTFWQPIIDKIEKRLLSWQRSHLSKGGRLTLLNATLTNLPTYYLSLFHLPSKVANIIESTYRNFHLVRT